MKKESTKSTAKEANTSEKKNIKESLVKELKAFAAKLGHTSKKIEKEIEKHAKQLAKKLVKPAKTEKPAAPKVKTKKAAAPKAEAEKSATAVNAPKLVAVDKKPVAPAKKEVAAKPVAVKKAAK